MNAQRMTSNNTDAIFRFDGSGDFIALDAAHAWCREHGISYGSLQRDDPVGLMVGNYEIAKWRNLSSAERKRLDGTLTGDKRNGPVFIRLTECANARVFSGKASA